MTVGHWLTVSEASRVLGLSRTTLLAAEEAGLLTALRTPGGHRRYDPAELRRYAERAGAGPGWDLSPEERPAAQTGSANNETDRAVDAAIVPAVRAAVRPLARALDADCAGLYLTRGGALRFVAAFGVPRWLAERLTAAVAPAPMTQVLSNRRTCLFDPAEVEFPEPRSTGHGVAVALPGAGEPIGAAFVVTRAALHAADLRVVEAFGELLALLVDDRHRIVELERRLHRIAAISTPP